MPVIYLSPSMNSFNKCLGGGDEQLYMNKLADEMEPYLKSSGIRYTRSKMGNTLGQTIKESNSNYYDLHLALHTNVSPENLAGKLRGMNTYYYSNSKLGKRAADIIVENYKTIYPTPALVKATPTLTMPEVRRTNAPAVLVETVYCDNEEDVNWLKSNLKSIAANLTKSLTQYFGILFINPQPPKRGTVTTQGGNLNIRAKPDIDSEIIAKAPNNSPVTVFGEWQGWYVVDYKGNVGYASSSYITL